MAVTVVNMIPQSLSNETFQDSEPNLAVNPANPLQIAGTAFTVDPAGGSNAPIFVSTDGGNTWSEVPALNGTSVFDIEFAPAPDGITYLGTQDSVRKSTDGGLSWATLNLGIGGPALANEV